MSSPGNSQQAQAPTRTALPSSTATSAATTTASTSRNATALSSKPSSAAEIRNRERELSAESSSDVAPLSAMPSDASNFEFTQSMKQPPTSAPPLPAANTLAAVEFGPPLVPVSSMMAHILDDAEFPSRAPRLPPTPHTAAILAGAPQAPPPSLPQLRNPSMPEDEIVPILGENEASQHDEIVPILEEDASQHEVSLEQSNPNALGTTEEEQRDQLSDSQPVRSPIITTPQPTTYIGYVPKSAADFFLLPSSHAPLSQPQRHGHADDNDAEHAPPVPPVRPDLRQSSRSALVVAIVATLLGLLFTILVQTSHCRLGLCDKIDRASLETATYKLKVQQMPAPLRLTAIATIVALFGLAATAAMMVRLVRAPPPPHEAGQLFAHVRPVATAFLLRIIVIILQLTVPLIVFTGLAASWYTAAASVFGILAVLVAPVVTLHTSLRTTPRIVSPAVGDTAAAAMQLAARLSTLVSSAGVASSLLAVSLAYLAVRDARALTGVAVATSGGAFILRLASTTFANVPDENNANKNERVNEIPDSIIPPSTSWRHPAVIAWFVGPQLASIAAQSAQVVAIFTVALVIPVTIGLSQPYFANNPHALCVLNHLYIDRECIAYRVPKVKTSFAVSLCRNMQFYHTYPKLTIGESNSMFVALPFLLAAAAMAATVLTTALFPVRAMGQTDDDVEDASDVFRSTTRLAKYRPYTKAAYVNIFVATLIVTVCAVGFCFGIFGSSSAFGRAFQQNFQKYELVLTGRNRCRPTMALGSNISEYPQLRRTVGDYRPLFSMGEKAPPTGSIAWRLLLCVLCGQAAALVSGSVVTLFSASAQPPALASATAAAGGYGDAMLDTVADAALGSVFVALGNSAAVLAGYRLFGPYGVGLTALGAATVCASTGALGVLHDVVEQAGRVCQTARSEARETARIDVLCGAAAQLGGFGTGTTVAAAGLAAAALIWAVADSGAIGFGGREVTGMSETLSPIHHVSDRRTIDVTNPFVLGPMMAGVWMVMLLGGLALYGTCRVAGRVGKEVRRQVCDGDGVIRRPKAVPDIDLGRCVRICGHGALVELAVPASLGVLWSLSIGLLVGRNGVLGSSVGITAAAVLFGGALSCGGRRMRQYDGDPQSDSTSANSSAAAGQGVRAGGRTLELVGMCVMTGALTAGTMAIVTCEVVAVDERKAWIGALATGGWLWAVVAVASLAKNDEDERRRQDLERHEQAAMDRLAIGDVLINPQAVSPFYEDGPQLAQRTMDPRSPLHAVAATGLTPHMAATERERMEKEEMEEEVTADNDGNGSDDVDDGADGGVGDGGAERDGEVDGEELGEEGSSNDDESLRASTVIIEQL